MGEKLGEEARGGKVREETEGVRSLP